MNKNAIIAFVLVTVGILVGSVALLWRFGSNEPKVIADVAGDARHSMGQGSIEVVEFSDLQCPACQAVHEPLKSILAKYEGKVKFVYRHYPLTTIHKNAMAAAKAAEAAGLQGKFFEMNDILFGKQQEWEGLDNPKDKFVEYGKSLELDSDQLLKDMDSQEVKDAVNSDNLAAIKYKLTGTPSFFVNGEAIDFQSLEAKLSELAK